MNEIEKRRTKKDAILARLADGQVHHMRELNAITFRYGGRIHELRRKGYPILTIRLGVDEYAYQMVEQQGELFGHGKDAIPASR